MSPADRKRINNYAKERARELAPRDPTLRVAIANALFECYLKGYELHRRHMQARAVPV